MRVLERKGRGKSVFILMLLVALFSCKKSKDTVQLAIPVEAANGSENFYFEGHTYNISNAVIVNTGETTDSKTNFEIILYSSSINMTNTGGVVSFSGQGSMLKVWMTADSKYESIPHAVAPSDDYYQHTITAVQMVLQADYDNGISGTVFNEDGLIDVSVIMVDGKHRITCSFCVTDRGCVSGMYFGKPVML